jgi:2-octaprenyl-6-methoxyphenol hydroxylase
MGITVPPSPKVGPSPLTARSDVVLVGAGPVGLLAALALDACAAGELDILIVDRLGSSRDGQQHQASPRAVALTTRSIRILDRLGIWPALREDAQIVTGIDLTDTSLEDALRLNRLTFDFDRAPDAEITMAILPEAALVRELQSAVGRRPAIKQMYSADIQGVSSHGALTTVTFAGGAALATPLIVAADGRNSALRRFAGIASVELPAQQFGIVANVAHTLPHHGIATQHFLPGGPFAILPLKGNTSCITWSEDKEVAERVLAEGEEALAHAIGKRIGGKLGQISLACPVAVWPLHRHAARALVGDRVALVGDAARSVHPIAGQGLNLGITDVAVLADCVVEAARLGLDLGAPFALERYETLRRPETTRAFAAFESLNGIFSSASSLGRVVRGIGLGAIGQLEVIKVAILAEARGLSGHLPSLAERRCSEAGLMGATP